MAKLAVIEQLDAGACTDLDASVRLRVEVGSAERGTRIRALLEEIAALKAGQSAYDPWWMWEELGLREAPDLSNPPPLAHERVGERVPGSAAASRAAAERFRARPGFDDASMVLDEGALRGDLEPQRFLRREGNADNDAGSEARARRRVHPADGEPRPAPA